MSFKKWNVVYTSAATGDQKHQLLLNGPQQDVAAVKAHVEKHVRHTVGAESYASTFVSATEHGQPAAGPAKHDE